ncbi:MAG: hypothetical protein ABJH45_21200 [Paracoccaceae bacterium]
MKTWHLIIDLSSVFLWVGGWAHLTKGQTEHPTALNNKRGRLTPPLLQFFSVVARASIKKRRPDEPVFSQSENV